MGWARVEKAKRECLGSNAPSFLLLCLHPLGLPLSSPPLCFLTPRSTSGPCDSPILPLALQWPVSSALSATCIWFSVSSASQKLKDHAALPRAFASLRTQTFPSVASSGLVSEVVWRENSSHTLLHLNAWSSLGGIVWEGSGGVSLGFEGLKPRAIPSYLSLPPPWGEGWKLSANVPVPCLPAAKFPDMVGMDSNPLGLWAPINPFFYKLYRSWFLFITTEK